MKRQLNSKRLDSVALVEQFARLAATRDWRLTCAAFNVTNCNILRCYTFYWNCTNVLFEVNDAFICKEAAHCIHCMTHWVLTIVTIADKINRMTKYFMLWNLFLYWRERDTFSSWLRNLKWSDAVPRTSNSRVDRCCESAIEILGITRWRMSK